MLKKITATCVHCYAQRSIEAPACTATHSAESAKEFSCKRCSSPQEFADFNTIKIIWVRTSSPTQNKTLF